MALVTKIIVGTIIVGLVATGLYFLITALTKNNNNTSTGTTTSTKTGTSTSTSSSLITSTKTSTSISSNTSINTQTTSIKTSTSITLQETEGPYWVEEGSLQRSDIRDGLVGVPLQLTIVVAKQDGTLIPNAQVDIWNASPYGTYSDEQNQGTLNQKFLRGYQLTNSNGVVQFITIYPGWETGRTPHIHVRVRVNNPTTIINNTTQLYLPEDVTNTVYTTNPYNTRGARTTMNSTDSLYNNSLLLTNISGNTTWGYTAQYVIYIPMV